MTRKRIALGSLLIGFGLPGSIELVVTATPKVLTGVTTAGFVAMTMLAGTLPVATAAGTGSMQPAITGGDRVIHEYGVTGVDAGDVVVFTPSNRETTYVHRAMFHVEKGENWYERANHAYIDAENCRKLTNCPAPHAGWITKGDANPRYDQAAGRSPPVKREWVEGTVVIVVDDDRALDRHPPNLNHTNHPLDGVRRNHSRLHGG